MKPVKSTAEILAFKALNRDVDKTWVDWAVDMLIAGFDTEHLTILAGESEPFNQFQMQELAEKVLVELQLDYSDKDQTIKNYACYLIITAPTQKAGFRVPKTVLWLIKHYFFKSSFVVKVPPFG
jgi:hypothetical protein